MMMLALTQLNSTALYAGPDSGKGEDFSYMLELANEMKAESELDSAFSIALRLEQDLVANRDTEEIVAVRELLGDLWRAKGDFTSALNYYMKALDAATLVRSKSALTNKIAGMHFRLGDGDNAAAWWQRSLAYRQEERDTVAELAVLLNLANFNYSRDSARVALPLTEQLSSKALAIGDTASILSGLNLRGLIYLELNQLEDAVKTLAQAKEYLKGDFSDSESAVRFNLTEAYVYSGDTPKAISAFRDYRTFMNKREEFRNQEGYLKFQSDLAEERSKTELAQTQLNAQKQQNRLLLLISALVIAGVILFMYARRQKAIRKAQTAAVLQAREQEQQRISQRLWQEIGKAMQQRDEQTSVFEGDQKTLDGAVQAAKYLSAQHFNPYLQVSLARALEFGCEQYGIQYGALITTEVEDVDVPMAQRKQLYKAFKRTLLDHLDTPGVDKLHVEMHAKEGRIELAITANEAPEKSVLYTAAEAEVAALGGKLKSKSDGAAHRTRIKVPIQG